MYCEEVKVPELGLDADRSITVSVWFVDPGDTILEGDRLVELLVDGATFDVTAPVAGELVEVLAFPDDVVEPGQVLGLVGVGGHEEEKAASEEAEPA